MKKALFYWLSDVAVVSDNDGSAFITKAEFDSLKNNFQAQIDNYNQSIDSKIDGAIASYLAGIKVNTDDTPEYKLYGGNTKGWFGVSANTFYIADMKVAMFGTNKTYTAYFYAQSQNKSDPFNIGVGWYLDGFYSSKSATSGWPKGLADDEYILCSCYTLASFKDRSASQGFMARKKGASMTENWLIGENNHADLDKLYLTGYSQLLGRPVGFIDPVIPLYEFMDAGDVSFKIWKITNGYHYEMPDHHGYHDGNSVMMDSHMLLVYMSPLGVETQIIHGGTMADSTVINLARTVEAGSSISLKFVATAAYTGGNDVVEDYNYGIFGFSDKLPGWKIAGTT